MNLIQLALLDRKWICVFVSILVLTIADELLTSNEISNDEVTDVQNDAAPQEINVGLWDPEVSFDPLNFPQNDQGAMDVSESVIAAMTYGSRMAPGGYVSPWQTVPGTYTRESYGGPRYAAQGYNRHSVYADYLGSPSYTSYAKQCLRSYGQTPRLTSQNLKEAFSYASYSMQQYTANEKQAYLSGNYLNASMSSAAGRQQAGVYRPQSTSVSPVYQKEKEALFNEYASKFLMQK